MNALHVLSTAASLVQDKKEGDSPHDRKISTGSCSDSGIEGDDENSRPVNQNLVTQEFKNQKAVNTESSLLDRKDASDHKRTTKTSSPRNIRYSSVSPPPYSPTGSAESHSNKTNSYIFPNNLSKMKSQINSKNVPTITNCKSAIERYAPYSTRKDQKVVMSQEFYSPTVDDHFRKSLGDKYDLLTANICSERPSSVDEHFMKALGTRWLILEQRKVTMGDKSPS